MKELVDGPCGTRETSASPGYEVHRGCTVLAPAEYAPRINAMNEHSLENGTEW